MENIVEQVAPENDIVEQAGEIETVTTEIQEADDTLVGQESVQEQIVAPDDWEQEIKDHLDSFGENYDAKKAFFDKHSSFAKGYSQKFTELDNDRKAFESERQGFEDNRNLSQGFKALEETCRGIGDNDLFNREVARVGGANNYFSGLHQVSAMLENPQTRLQAIANICDAYQVTPQMLQNGVNDPQYIAMQNEQKQAQSMESQFANFKDELKREQEAKEAEQVINGFVGATDEAGNALYPHFELVRNQMATELEYKGIEKPTQQDLAAAYQNACYSNPELRAELIQAEIKKQAMEQANSVKAQQVKKAEAVVGVRSTKKQPSTKQQSWQAHLNNMLDDMPDE